jgi:2-keto-4-pentenoate hydratase/2-oxohepta-3-ene-1,7-dioic acid hydratase in catechol pathway
MGMKKNGKAAPSYLKAGDTIALGIDGLGAQHQRVVAFKKH